MAELNSNAPGVRSEDGARPGSETPPTSSPPSAARRHERRWRRKALEEALEDARLNAGYINGLCRMKLELSSDRMSADDEDKHWYNNFYEDCLRGAILALAHRVEGRISFVQECMQPQTKAEDGPT